MRFFLQEKEREEGKQERGLSDTIENVKAKIPFQLEIELR